MTIIHMNRLIERKEKTLIKTKKVQRKANRNIYKKRIKRSWENHVSLYRFYLTDGHFSYKVASLIKTTLHRYTERKPDPRVKEG